MISLFWKNFIMFKVIFMNIIIDITDATTMPAIINPLE